MKFDTKIIISETFDKTQRNSGLTLRTRLSYMFLLFMIASLLLGLLLSPLWVILAFFMDSFIAQFFTLLIFGPIAVFECRLIYLFFTTKALLKNHVEKDEDNIIDL